MEPKCLTSSPTSLGAILKKRLLLMNYIASYKMKHHLPVEDTSQEQLVMVQMINQAERIGLVSSSLVPFVDTQMKVAKAIQYRCKAKWQISPEHGLENKEIFIVRGEINMLDQALLCMLKSEIHNHGRLLNSSIEGVIAELASVDIQKEEVDMLKNTLMNVLNNRMIDPRE